MTTDDLGTLIVAELRRCGLDATISESGVSESFYISFDDGELRISDHDLPATYTLGKGRNWIDAYLTAARVDATHWSAAVLRLVTLAGHEPSAWLQREADAGKALLDQARRQQALEAERIATAQRHAVSRQADNEALLAAHGKSGLTGAARKRWLKKMREKGIA